MERQLKKTFKSRTPKLRRVNTSRMAYGFRTRRSLGGVMIVPPKPGTEKLIDQEMKKIRAGYIEKMGGQTEYDNQMKKVNEEFKALMASRGVRV